MDFTQLMEQRYSCREYTDEPLSAEELQELIEAANAAPVGSARYMDLHMTVVRDREILSRLSEALFVRVEKKKQEMAAIVETVESQSADSMPKDPFYGAPAVIFISHKQQDLQPGIEWCNAMNLA
ncbi:MAG: nitroreductase family protein, partial [Eubacterium sp.]|nr:nitroreductase family protein [Eubacterium sp.]